MNKRNLNIRAIWRYLIDTLVIFESLGLVIFAGIVLALLHGGASIAALLEGRMVAYATAVALLLYLSGTITLAYRLLIKRQIAALCLAAAALLGAYFMEVRPLICPPPLAASLPDDTTFFASVDLVNIVRMAGVFGDALGRDRVRALLYPEAVIETTAAPEKSVFDVASGWISREVLVAGGDISANPPEYALLIGSRNKKRAEADFPGLADMMFSGAAANSGGAAPQNKTAYTKEAFEGQTIFCATRRTGSDAASGGVGANASDGGSGYCWASADGAVIVSAAKPFLKKIISRMNCGSACGKSRFLALYEKDESPERIVYAYADGRPAADVISDMLRHSSGGRDAADALREIKGAEYSFSYCGLELRQKTSLLLEGGGGRLSKYSSSLAKPGKTAFSGRGVKAALEMLQGTLNAISANRSLAEIKKSPGGSYSVTAGGATLAAFRFEGGNILVAPDEAWLSRLKEWKYGMETSGGSANVAGFEIDYDPATLLAATGLGPSRDNIEKTTLEKEYFNNATNATILLLRAMSPGKLILAGDSGDVENGGTVGGAPAITVEWRQRFKPGGLKSYPFGAIMKASSSHYAVVQERAAAEAFESCTAEVARVKHGMDALLTDTGGLSGAGKYADGVCHYITPGAMSPAACAGKVRKRVESACEPGSFSVKYLKGDKYDILAKVRGDGGCRICATEKSVFPSSKKNFKDDKGWYCFH